MDGYGFELLRKILERNGYSDKSVFPACMIGGWKKYPDLSLDFKPPTTYYFSAVDISAKSCKKVQLLACLA